MFFSRTSLFVLCLLLWATTSYAQSNVRAINVTFTTIDVPGAGVTGIYGINSAGDMVGYYGTNSNDPNKHGFLFSGGSFAYLDYPNAYATFAYGINDAGTIVGSAEFQGGLTAIGYSYNGSTYSAIRDGSGGTTITYSINNSGEIVGGAGTAYTTKGIAARGTKFKNLNVPGTYTYVFASGVNSTGTIVGWTDMDGFVCKNTSCKIVDVAGASQTANRGINDAGVMVGWYFLGGVDYAFASRNGKYLSFAYPGALGTFADAINASGQIVGQYTLDYQTFHGFVTNPITAEDFH